MLGWGLTIAMLLLLPFAGPAVAGDDRDVRPSEVATTDITVTLSPVADADVVIDQPDANFGAAASVKVGPELFEAARHVYLKFDLSSIPADATIVEATLAMSAYSGFAWGNDGNVYASFVPEDAWTEMGLTWNNRPAPAAEILGSWWLWYDDFLGSQVDYQVGSTTGGALLTRTQAEAGGDDLLSIRLHSPGYRTLYRTREFAEAARRPGLTLRYTLNPTPAATSSWGAIKTRYR